MLTEMEGVTHKFIRKLQEEGCITFKEAVTLYEDTKKKSVIDFDDSSLSIVDNIDGRNLLLRIKWDGLEYDRKLFIKKDDGEIDFIIRLNPISKELKIVENGIQV